MRRRLFTESVNFTLRIHLKNTELTDIFFSNWYRRNRDIRVTIFMKTQKLRIVHTVKMVSRENQKSFRLFKMVVR